MALVNVENKTVMALVNVAKQICDPQGIPCTNGIFGQMRHGLCQVLNPGPAHPLQRLPSIHCGTFPCLLRSPLSRCGLGNNLHIMIAGCSLQVYMQTQGRNNF